MTARSLNSPRRWLAGPAAACLVFSFGALAGVPATGLDLDALKGKVVYVDFWASWCVPCRQSFPWMAEMQRRYGKDGLVIVAVDLDAVRADADTFLNEFVPSFRIAYDPEGALAERFHVKGMPTSFLIDRDGKTQLMHAGFRAKDREPLEAQMRALVGAH